MNRQLIAYVQAYKADNDRNDCTVRALAAVTGITYEAAYALAAASGRKPNKGMYSRDLIKYIKAAGDQGLTFRKVRMKPRTMYKFLAEHPTGRFYCRRRSHAFAVIDGAAINEWQGDRTMILDAWQLMDAVPKTEVDLLLSLCPISMMDAACELDTSYRRIQGLALTLIRNGRARWFRKRLVTT